MEEQKVVVCSNERVVLGKRMWWYPPKMEDLVPLVMVKRC